MADPTPTWDDFYNEGLGPQIPLSEVQRALGPSGVLPSGEANSFDFRQQGSGINQDYPYPNLTTSDDLAFESDADRATFPDAFSDEWWAASGVVKTYPESSGALADDERESGIFHFQQLLSRFSNASEVSGNQIDDFTIFNSYIHHQRLPANNNNAPAIQIPFVSTYSLSIDWNAYAGPGGFTG